MNIRRYFKLIRNTIRPEPSLSDLMAPAIGMLAIGIVAGAGVALLFAPSSGRTLRENVTNKLGTAKTRVLSQADELLRKPTGLNNSSMEHR